MNKIDILSKRLKEAKDSFDAMKKVGINEEILIIYLMHKTKLPRKKIKEILVNEKEFFENLISEEVLKEI